MAARRPESASRRTCVMDEVLVAINPYPDCRRADRVAPHAVWQCEVGGRDRAWQVDETLTILARRDVKQRPSLDDRKADTRALMPRCGSTASAALRPPLSTESQPA